MELCIQSGNSIALELSQCMVAFLAVASSISKPQLFNWKMGLVSEETAVLSQLFVILITVTNKAGACAGIIHPACANLLPITR